jgi:hypothetical protein
MIPEKWRLANRGDTGSGEEASASIRDLDLRAVLKASTAHIAPPASLRARVLSSFDQRAYGRGFSLKWLVGVTAVLIAVVLTGLVLRVVNPPRTSPTSSSATTVSQSIPQTTTPQQANVPFSPVDRVRRKGHSLQKAQSGAIAANRREVESAAGFNSLLYCDSFTCGDSMQLVRVQLPAATLGPAYRPLARNGYLTAELIVGTDGVTRALRIEK